MGATNSSSKPPMAVMGRAPWLQRPTGPSTPLAMPQMPQQQQPGVPWYAEQLAASRAKDLSQDQVNQMLLARAVADQQAAVARKQALQGKSSKSWFGRFGIDPLSRAVGLEPKSFGQTAGRAFGFDE